MKWNLFDMMEHMECIPVELREQDAVSAERIREMTMKKIQDTNQEREISMNTKTNQKRRSRRMSFVAAVAAVLLLGVPAGVAMGNGGFFTDRTNGLGTVTGTAYENAGSEIGVEAAYAEDTLYVTAIFTAHQEAPFSELETLAVGSYQVLDASGDVAAEGETKAVSLTDGAAVFLIPAQELAEGTYQVRIESFEGSKKADQLLTITGPWECAFQI